LSAVVSIVASLTFGILGLSFPAGIGGAETLYLLELGIPKLLFIKF